MASGKTEREETFLAGYQKWQISVDHPERQGNGCLERAKETQGHYEEDSG
jgi:hypothetical protein